MHDQPRYTAYQASSFFADNSSARSLPQGTVARGQLRDDTLLYTGKVGEDDATEMPFAVDEALMARGRVAYNAYCSHCHGPNAEQGERPRDLRRLKLRYGDNRAETFRTTVAKGRPDKGMPSWTGVLPDEVRDKIWAFLETVQQ